MNITARRHAPAAFAALLVSPAALHAASPLAPRPNGMQPGHPTRVLIDNATVHVSPDETLDRADILIENGRIVRVAGTIEPGQGPAAGARVIDAEGLHVYAGFIDAYVPVDAPAPTAGAPGTHWSNLVTPQRDALAGKGLPKKDAEKLRKLGFTAAGIAPASGIFRGHGAVVSAAEPFDDPSLGSTPVYRANAAQHLGFETSNWSSGDYPTSHMGVVALLRQSFIDAAQRASSTKDGSQHTDASCLDHIDPEGLLIYDSSFPLEAMLADKVSAEFGHTNVAIVGSGNEFKRLDALADSDRPLIVPLVFPKAPDVFSVGEADATSLDDLMSWEHAPANARYLYERRVNFAITSSKLPKSQKFWENMEKAIDAGLPGEEALAALTTTPARILDVSDQLGTVEAGKAANLVIASNDLFDTAADATILELYIDGRPHHINDAEDTRFDGRWNITVVGAPFTMAMEIDGQSITNIEGDAKNKARKVTIKDERISFLVDDDDDASGTYLVSGVLTPDGTIRGTGVAPDQSTYEWTATREGPVADAEDAEDNDKSDKEDNKDTLTTAPVGAPFANYTVAEQPQQKTYLLTNATVWTQSDKGILENAWVLVVDGKVRSVGTGGVPEIAAETIDCSGKHITPGLIDAHSHTGLFQLGVNEAGQAVTSECRIADSLDPGHINWYRQLAGGVTTANLLHGSANPIGGQSQTVKVRWGAPRPEAMLFEDAKPGIKFALGENVKQSNWGDDNTTRYPQTRLGVETLMRDRFTKAAEYGLAHGILKQAPRSGSFFTTERPNDNSQQLSIEGLTNRIKNLRNERRSVENKARGNAEWANELVAFDQRIAQTQSQLDAISARDLELETLAQILAGQRLIHCHSYRQDEILMLCRIAEDFGFTIGTFQHGLETYKVAEIVKEHAIGTSIFSDWWAYKVEVQDAIPYAGPINFEVGLLTSFNSDSDDLARRMNVEAGKALRYARASGIDMTPQDALNFVTMNPARQLMIDRRVGSIEPGKDADLAVWSGDPLSSMSRCEQTFVDGRQLFSLEQDQAHRDRMQAERARLVAKILEEGKPEPKDTENKEPETIADPDERPTRRSLLARTYERALNDHVEHGTQPGECGCNLLPRQILYLND